MNFVTTLMGRFGLLKEDLDCHFSGLRNPVAMIMLGLAAWCTLWIVPGGGVAYAQNTNATIRGQVLDPTGALVPNAQVVI
jgi:hypothetical protein